MAYDPNDAADKKIVADLVKAAVATAVTELEEAHEAGIAGLKTKNTELLKKLREGGNSADDVAKLETQLEASAKALKDMTKEHKAAVAAVKEATEALAVEAKVNHTLLVDNGLTDALVKVNVHSDFMPAVRALLAPQVTIKQTGDVREAVIGDKALGVAVTEWSQGDQGKHFISANVNGGTGAPGSKVPLVNAKNNLQRAAYDVLTPAAQAAHFAGGGTLTD